MTHFLESKYLIYLPRLSFYLIKLLTHSIFFSAHRFPELFWLGFAHNTGIFEQLPLLASALPIFQDPYTFFSGFNAIEPNF